MPKDIINAKKYIDRDLMLVKSVLTWTKNSSYIIFWETEGYTGQKYSEQKNPICILKNYYTDKLHY